MAEIGGQLREAFVLPLVVAAQGGRDLSGQRHRDAVREQWQHVEFLRREENVAYQELTAPDAEQPDSSRTT